MYMIRALEEGGTEVGAGRYVWVALGIFFMMVILGWLASSKGWLKKEETAASSEHDHQKDDIIIDERKIVQIEDKLDSDDLTSLEGIGPKVSMVLSGIGITTFEALANADYSKLKMALDGAGYKYMDPAGWIEQSALAAKGDMDGLKKLQLSLKGGRKVG